MPEPVPRSVEDRQVKCPSQEGLTHVRVRDKLWNQTWRKDHQAYHHSKGSYQPKARKTGPPPHCVYRWMPQEPAAVTIRQSYRQSPGCVRNEPDGNPGTRHCMWLYSTIQWDILGWDMHKTMNDHHVTPAESRAGKSSKHQPEPQEANTQTTETDQGRCNAIQVEPRWIPWAPTEPTARWNTPGARATTRKGWIEPSKIRREGRRCERDRHTRPMQRKAGGTRRTPQETVSKVPAKSDRDSTKKEQGMEGVSNS